MDALTRKALDYLRQNAERYKRDFGSTKDTFGFIQCIKQLRNDFPLINEKPLFLKEAKDAVEEWRDSGFPGVPPLPDNVQRERARAIVENLILRKSFDFTTLEIAALEELLK